MTKAEGLRRSRLLRGRLLVLGIVLCAVYLLGRITAPEGVGKEELWTARAALERAERQIATLELALQTRAEVETAQPTAPTASPAPVETPPSGRRIYVVQSGDTMRGIAQTFCGDPDLARFVAAFNDLTDPALISVGMKLRLPSDCDL